MDIKLSDSEVDLLREILQKDIHELVMEIAKTDHREFREQLKKKEAMLEGLFARLSS